MGHQGQNAAKYLRKGRGVAIDGRLEWRDWTTPDGQKRSAVGIVAEHVQFLSSCNGGGESHPQLAAPAEAAPVADPEAAFEAPTGDDDIPF